jgi:nucleotide-binding universal stress UspA family protein
LVVLFERILVPLDGSEYSEKAVDYAIGLAKKFSSEIVLVHVVQSTAAVVTGPEVLGPSLLLDLKKRLEENGHRILSSAEERARKEGVKASSKMDYGNPADRIVNAARDEKADLIVIADRGLGSVARFFLGSVANQVSHHASCPVLLIKS